MTLSTGSALEERSFPDIKPTNLVLPSQKTHPVKATDLILPSHSINSSPLSDLLLCAKPLIIGTDTGYIPQLDCYYLFYEQLNVPDVYTSKAMQALMPRPDISHGRCYLKVRGFSERSVATLRSVDTITAAARIVEVCYGEAYEGVLFGGSAAMRRGDQVFWGTFHGGPL